MTCSVLERQACRVFGRETCCVFVGRTDIEVRFHAEWDISSLGVRTGGWVEVGCFRRRGRRRRCRRPQGGQGGHEGGQLASLPACPACQPARLQACHLAILLTLKGGGRRRRLSLFRITNLARWQAGFSYMLAIFLLSFSYVLTMI